ncbi:OmpA family protein [Bernardetia sp. MNP-M8]|uniref:OmpA family protein n=1 Tax=Bernardetia sp. MNP-M8 TaxID=3127470 RepID=UPI0030D18454
MKKCILTFLFCFCSYLCFATWIDHQHFKTGETELNEDAKRELNKVVVYLKEHPFVNIKISGFADKYECKDSLDAIRLGWERAHNCQYYLSQRGISKCRMPIYSYGKNRPTVPSDINGVPNKANQV